MEEIGRHKPSKYTLSSISLFIIMCYLSEFMNEARRYRICVLLIANKLVGLPINGGREHFNENLKFRDNYMGDLCLHFSYRWFGAKFCLVRARVGICTCLLAFAGKKI